MIVLVALGAGLLVLSNLNRAGGQSRDRVNTPAPMADPYVVQIDAYATNAARGRRRAATYAAISTNCCGRAATDEQSAP